MWVAVDVVGVCVWVPTDTVMSYHLPLSLTLCPLSLFHFAPCVGVFLSLAFEVMSADCI